jgi:hypothetical protein
MGTVLHDSRYFGSSTLAQDRDDVFLRDIAKRLARFRNSPIVEALHNASVRKNTNVFACRARNVVILKGSSAVPRSAKVQVWLDSVNDPSLATELSNTLHRSSTLNRHNRLHMKPCTENASCQFEIAKHSTPSVCASKRFPLGRFNRVKRENELVPQFAVLQQESFRQEYPIGDREHWNTELSSFLTNA